MFYWIEVFNIRLGNLNFTCVFFCKQIAELKSEINEQKDLNNKLQTKITLAELNEKRIRKQLKMDIDVKGTKLVRRDYYLESLICMCFYVIDLY